MDRAVNEALYRESQHVALRAEIAAAMRRVELAEARVTGLIQAQVSTQSVLWYSRDAARQLVFEEAFDEGRRLLRAELVVAGTTGNRPPVSQSGDVATPRADSETRRREGDASGGVDGDDEDTRG